MTAAAPDLPGVLPAFGWHAGGQGRALFLIAIAFSAFQIVTAAFSPLPSLIVRAVHVGFLLLMTFALFPGFTARTRPYHSLAWALGLTGFGLAFYHWVFEAELIQRAGDPTTVDMVIGIATIVLVLSLIHI